MPEQPLFGRCAVVTGGAVRVGRTIALRLAAAGADVCIHFGSSIDAAEEVADELRAAGVRSATVQADFSRDPPAAAKSVLSAANAQLGPIDLLVNSVAIFEPGTLAETTPDGWNRHLDVNLATPVWLIHEFAKQLPSERRGAVVNIVDWRGLRPQSGHFAYTIAKAGLVAATRLLAQELGPRISVNAVAPGAILPPPGGSQQEFEQLAERNPLQRTGTPDDVADAVVYFAASRFITGEILCVTGGQQL